MEQPIAPKERAELAKKCGVSDQYLYQCLSGRRDMDATQAALCERDSGGRLRRWMLRRDWDVTWPELIGAEGAPSLAAPSSADKKAA